MSFLIATPMYGGQCTAEYFESSLNLKEDLTSQGVEHDWYILKNESLITRARNTAVAAFLKTKYEALFFIDADIRYSSEDVAKLWNLDAPIAVGAYRMKTEDVKYSAWKDGSIVSLDDHDGPVSVDYGATGFMCIKRDVFKDLANFVPSYGEDGEKLAYFQTPVVDGVQMSEDYFFCDLYNKVMRDSCGPIMLDPSIRLGHMGSREYAD